MLNILNLKILQLIHGHNLILIYFEYPQNFHVYFIDFGIRFPMT